MLGLPILGLLAKVAWQAFTGGGLQGIVQAVTAHLDRLNDAKTKQFETGVGAQKDVKIAELQAGAQAWHDRVNLLKGLRLTAFLVAFAMAPPLWHEALVFFDSCPFLPWPSWSDGAYLPSLVTMHVQGSWQVAALPGPYGEHEWAIIAALIGIQTAGATVLGVIRYLKT